MRKGYWRTLTRQMRDKVRLGENAFICADGAMVNIAFVDADPDADLEHCSEVLLARDDSGNPLTLDTSSSAVFILQADGTRHVLAADLMSFIHTLHASTPSGLCLGDAIGEPLDFPMPRRGIFDD